MYHHKQKIYTTCILFLIILMAVGCRNENDTSTNTDPLIDTISIEHTDTEEKNTAAEEHNTAAEEHKTAAEEQNTDTKEQNTDTGEPTMIMKIGDQIVPVLWEGNASVEELRSLAKEGITIPMSMYGGFEQVGSIGTDIIRADEQMTTGAGDVVLYSGNRLVVFYGSNSWAYTRLGRVNLSEEELKKLLGNGDVVISLEIDS